MVVMSEAKQIFLHIGHYKTGTSAIQDFLSGNAHRLREYGFLYPACARPRNNPTNHGHLSLSLARAHGFRPPPWYREEMSPDAAFADLDETLAGAPEDRVILSSEEFVQLAMRKDPDAAVQDLKDRLAAHRVTVVFFIREPLSLLKSWFNEVNKGPVPTKTFPVFFMNLNEVFLSQQRIWAVYARHFGAENVRLVTYKNVGSAHLAEFLSVVGCAMPPPEQTDLVQQAQPEETLELTRLSKERPGTLDDHTVTAIGDVARFHRRAARIGAAYDQVAQHADEPRPSQLTAEAVIDHYARLLRPLQQTETLNQKEAENLRDLALKAEDVDIGLARALMQAAQVIRPEGKLINRKVAEYLDKLS